VAPLRKSRSSGIVTSQLIELPVRVSDAALVAALQAGRTEARRVFFDRTADDIERLLYRILGPDSEIGDLLQEVFLIALSSIGQLREPEALRGWLRGIAVRRARKCILRRQRWRFIQLFAPSDLPEREAPVPSAEVSEALRCTYAVLEQLPPDERVAFALRHVDGLELTAVAQACGVSLATIKRRLARAQRTFVSIAGRYPVLAEWLEGGGLTS
jgi:RNA polymerase sigma-70 factor (ECF subfamily)